ncbi:H-type lectin domain-containing protein [Bacillus cereus]|uniref:H-type lectin domain-containing protein n=2 Tax=Bacillus cereus TaxID=1396 RepID=A0AAW5L4M5_BACCE|nr:H-type lectin domain-containing protein [Bacillus cereus]MCQ6289196.1 H-type lectin domain-containing protein [Bacillus cereus]MCQ6318704.1 H-type lectin domain-containing protein [Bacillus cereus]MCQ6331458.1 H-type lectin domain-containing protein [Bacillus cereus]
MVQIQRKYNFMPGTTISSGQVNEEFTNLVNAHNDNDTIVQNVNEYMFSKNNVRAGKTDFIQISRGQTLQKQIVWSPAFSKVPFVTVTAANGDIGTGDIVVYLSQVTVTSFTLTVHNKSTTRDISLAFHYIAISMG